MKKTNPIMNGGLFFMFIQMCIRDSYLIRGDAYPASKFLVSYDDSRFSYLSFRRRSLYSISKNNYPY